MYVALLMISNVHIFLLSPSARPQVFFLLPFARLFMALLLKQYKRVAVFAPLFKTVHDHPLRFLLCFIVIAASALHILSSCMC